MFKLETQELEWGGRPLRLETGRLARQADGAVLVSYGETCVLATVVAERTARAGLDFFPLTVNYMEKTYAAGKIPGGYFKREGRPTEKETLVSRLIDRPLRPLFPAGFRCETQLVATVMSHDLENDPDMVAMIAASAALRVSGIPFEGPVGAARVGYLDGAHVLNPTAEQMEKTALDLVVAGTKDAVLMVESEAQELSEQVMLDAVMFGHQQFQPVLEAIERLGEAAARPPMEWQPPASHPLAEKVAPLVTSDLEAAFNETDKQKRGAQVAAARARLDAELLQTDEADEAARSQCQEAFKKAQSQIVRQRVLSSSQRIDGRGLADVRPIAAEVRVLPRTHGAALFTRGETQALAVATLGTGDDEQFVDALEGTRREHFLLHYNFPPFSVGEVGRIGFTGRREVGHGKLAWRALRAALPSKEEFPYTLRVVSEITESNGSSSMATVCCASLALMDAGVPMRAPVAGIAMGLIKDGDKVAILSDILGDEDHLGDMDFKVAGTESGITALQMDIKITGITQAIMRDALAQAKEGRTHILAEMAKALPA
ncbi:MAG: polyribonucleotide nucleotidyltransferase, partial [Hyphomicrobiales bacterium]|nr:polyribonucleotide nucleotidyltransferase [Hyphomicrobiales bacterium]